MSASDTVTFLVRDFQKYRLQQAGYRVSCRNWLIPEKYLCHSFRLILFHEATKTGIQLENRRLSVAENPHFETIDPAILKKVCNEFVLEQGVSWSSLISLFAFVGDLTVRYGKADNLEKINGLARSFSSFLAQNTIESFINTKSRKICRALSE